jgi:2'-5' RNA ligase
MTEAEPPSKPQLEDTLSAPMAPNGSEELRTIGVAVGIPEPWGSFLDNYRKAAGDPLAPYIPSHVTLLPPTEIPAVSLPEIEEHLRKVAISHHPFELHLRGTGTFRPVTDVVFVAVAQGISECELLERDVRCGPLTRELSFPYHPHVTVAHGVAPEKLDTAYDGLAGFEARFSVWGFTLFEHGTDGRWRPQRDFPFGDAPVGPVPATGA